MEVLRRLVRNTRHSHFHLAENFDDILEGACGVFRQLLLTFDTAASISSSREARTFHEIFKLLVIPHRQNKDRTSPAGQYEPLKLQRSSRIDNPETGRFPNTPPGRRPGDVRPGAECSESLSHFSLFGKCSVGHFRYN